VDFDQLYNIKSLKLHRDKRGCLVAFEFKQLPFRPNRLFTVTDVPPFTVRGGHAHKKNHQYLMVVSGVMQVQTCDGNSWYNDLLGIGQCKEGKPMTWCQQRYVSENAALLVLCSEPYEAADYIHDFKQFLNQVHNEDRSRHDIIQ